jgi:hypothetical protein
MSMSFNAENRREGIKFYNTLWQFFFKVVLRMGLTEKNSETKKLILKYVWLSYTTCSGP